MNQHAETVSKQKICPVCGQRFARDLTNCPDDDVLLTDVDPLIGEDLDGIQVMEFIGQGGVSLVYKAHHQGLDRVVAVKVLKPEYMWTAVNIDKFLREAQAAIRLQHPSVNAIHSIGVTSNGQPYLVLEFLSGLNLAQLLKEAKPLENTRLVQLFVQICEGLEHAHERGVIHRDLKPSNVVVTSNGDGTELAKIMDFGTATLAAQIVTTQQQLTQAGEVFGALKYMSPEQKLGKEADARSDIYAVGRMFFEALERNGIVPESLRPIVTKAIAESPADRFQTAAEMKSALQSVAAGAATTLARNSCKSQAVPRKPSLRICVVATLSVCLLAGAAVWFSFSDIDRSRMKFSVLRSVGAPHKQVICGAEELANKIIDSGSDVREALETLECVLPLVNQADQSTRSRIYFDLGRAYCKLKQRDAASNMANRIISLSPNRLRNKPDELMSRWLELTVLAKTIEPVSIQHLDDLVSAARILEEKGLFAEAGYILSQAAEHSVHSSLNDQLKVRILNTYLDFCLRRNDTRQAMETNECLYELLEKTGQISNSKYAFVRLRHGEQLRIQGRFLQAFRLFVDVLNSTPKGSEAKCAAALDLGLVSYDVGRIDSAHNYFEMAAQSDSAIPDELFVRVHDQLTHAKLRSQDFDSALADLAKMEKRLGSRIYSLPEGANYADAMILCLSRKGRTPEALRFGEEALNHLTMTKSDRSHVAHVAARIAEISMGVPDYDKAVQYLRIAYAGTASNVHRAEFARQLGDCYCSRNEPVVAEQYFRKALKIASDSSVAYQKKIECKSGLVNSLTMQGRLKEASAMMSEVVAALGNQLYDPCNFNLVQVYLRLLRATGQTTEFIDVLKKGIAQQPANSVQAKLLKQDLLRVGTSNHH